MEAGKFIMIDPLDNVATALTNAEPGEKVYICNGKDQFEVMTEDFIPFGHKMAVSKIGKGDSVIKYGLPIGKATEDIFPGRHVHVHNVESCRGRGDKRGYYV